MNHDIRVPRLAASAALAAALTLGACTGDSPASVPHPSPQAPPADLADLLAPDFGDITELAEGSGP